MSLLDLFRSRRVSSASTAKERLQIIVSHERTRQQLRGNAINLQELKQKLVSVISEYLHIDEEQFSVQLQHDADHSVLEMNVTLPDTVDA